MLPITSELSARCEAPELPQHRHALPDKFGPPGLAETIRPAHWRLKPAIELVQRASDDAVVLPGSRPKPVFGIVLVPVATTSSPRRDADVGPPRY